MFSRKIRPPESALTLALVLVSLVASGQLALNTSEVQATSPTVAEVVNIDFTSTTRTDSTLLNSGAQKVSDLTIFGAPTGDGTQDGLTFSNTNTGSTNQYLTGNLGSTSLMTRIEIEMVAKFPDSGCAAQSNGSMVFSLSGSNPYNIYRHSNVLGFNTFNSDIFGVNIADKAATYHTYRFILAPKPDLPSAQEIWIDGVKQDLGFRTTSGSSVVAGCSSIVGTTENPNGRSLSSDGSFLFMTHSFGVNTWGTTGSIKSLRITTTTGLQAPTEPSVGSITAGDGSLSVPFTAPGSNGGAAISNYQYSVDNGATWTTRSPISTSSPLVISSLSNGTPYDVQIRAINSEGNGAASVNQSATPLAPGGGVASISPATQTLTGVTNISLTPSASITTSGFTGSVTYSITAGTLPAGLSLNASTGVISGTPTVSSTGNVTVAATGSSAGTATANVTFSILSAQNTLTIPESSGTVGTPLALTTAGGSGAGAVSYTVADGTAIGCSIAARNLTANSAGTCLVTATKAASGEYSSVVSSQTTITFSVGASSTVSEPTPTASPTLSPTPAPAVTPRPKPSITPVVPLAPAIRPSPTPTPTPSRTPVLGDVNLIPKVDSIPGVVYGSVNPIPTFLDQILSRPLAYGLDGVSGSPEIPELNPRESMVFQNGSPIKVNVSKNDQLDGYIFIGDDWTVNLKAADASSQSLNLDDSGNIVLNRNGYLQFSGTGFAPGSTIKVWLFSEPTSLAKVMADSSGNYTGSVPIPESLSDGEHTIQLNGVSEDGQIRSAALGILIQPELVVLPATPVGFDLGLLMNILWIFALLTLLAFFLIFWRRRERKDKRDVIPESVGGESIFVDEAFTFEPSQQMPEDSRRRIGAASPPNRKRTRFSFKPKGA